MLCLSEYCLMNVGTIVLKFLWFSYILYYFAVYYFVAFTQLLYVAVRKSMKQIEPVSHSPLLQSDELFRCLLPSALNTRGKSTSATRPKWSWVFSCDNCCFLTEQQRQQCLVLLEHVHQWKNVLQCKRVPLENTAEDPTLVRTRLVRACYLNA